MIRRSTWHVLPLLLILGLAGCGSESKSAGSGNGAAGDAELTQYQRDSMLSTSRIPGAAGVGAAMRAADATSRGIRSADSVSP